MKVLIINGTATSGKDKFVELFAKNYPYVCLNWSTIDIVKEIGKKHFDWNGEKNEVSRLFLSELKRIWSEFNNGPFNYMLNKIDLHYQKLNEESKKSVVYFIHCREPEEIQKFANRYGENCRTILLKRNNIKIPDNKSDKRVDNYKYDYIIANNEDIKNLESQALNLAIMLGN